LNQLRLEMLSRCLSPGPSLAPPRHGHRLWDRMRHRPARCKVPLQREGRLVLAVVVRDQSRLLEYWVAWHHLLGAFHIIVYDNGRRVNPRRADPTRLIRQRSPS